MKVYSQNVFCWATCALESCVESDYNGPVTQLKSSSKQSQTNAPVTTNTSKNLNVQDTEGITVGEAGGNVTIVQTDQNAFDNATALAERAVSVGESLGNDALSLALKVSQGSFDSARDTADAINEATGAALKFGDRAFSSVERALGEVGGAYSEAAAFNKSALTTQTDFLGDVFSGLRGFVSDITARAQDSLGSTVTALNTIAREQSKSTDERVAEVSQNSIKYMVIGLGLIAGGLTIYAIFKRG